tara:strand:+ start:1740 stop:3050 length:1311 start_codon:yes stop_codon:yes gene_type:complete
LKSKFNLNVFPIALWLALVLGLSGCDKLFEQPKQAEQAPEQAQVNTEALLSAANLYVYTQMSEALSGAQELDSVITSLLHHPNPGTLEEAQLAWIKAYSAYIKVSFFSRVPRFEKPQFRDQNDTYARIEERIDSWPIEPGYIDYLPLYPLSGIVNDLTLKINEEDVSAQHGFSDMRFASLGFHPIEFLLFGENGKRSAKDFIPQENSIEVVSADTAIKEDDSDELSHSDDKNSETHEHVHVEIDGPQNHNRRRDYLRLLSALVVKNLQKLTDRWEPAHGYYAKQWRQPQPSQQLASLTLVYQSMVDSIQKTLLEKHFSVLLNQKQVDDLRSPFSNQDVNNMHDLVMGIESLLNMESGFISALRDQDAESADKMTAVFKRLLRDMKQLPQNLTSLPLDKRKARILPVQEKVLQLLEQLYKGAIMLQLPIRALPVSTS